MRACVCIVYIVASLAEERDGRSAPSSIRFLRLPRRRRRRRRRAAGGEDSSPHV